MREMHKWKDKVELNLDNRQIFFLFFGLSIVGCFVFALGVMVGRRVEFGAGGEVASLTNGSLAMLDGQSEAQQSLSFKDGLQEPATEGLPQTRDPATLDQPEEDTQESPSPEPAKPAAKPDPKQDTTLASGSPAAKPSKSAKKAIAGAKFTLQMKAFSRKEDAEIFAQPLRANGHDVRVESHEVKGRLWHRVRVGAFDEWAAGLAAKERFEKTESIIAYVVRL